MLQTSGVPVSTVFVVVVVAAAVVVHGVQWLCVWSLRATAISTSARTRL